MNRYAIVGPDDYNGGQQAAIEVIAGSKGGVHGAFQVLLYNPALAHTLEKCGGYMRFKNSLPDQLNELALSICGRY